MKIKVTILLILLLGNFNLMAQLLSKTVSISCSENDAIIYANSNQMGTGIAQVVIPYKGSIIVEVKKNGFLPYSKYFYNMKNMPKPPKTFHFILEKDDSYDASSINDVANRDVEITTSKSEDEAWKLFNMIITDYFEIIDVQDKNAGYIKTSWVVQNFKENTIRTKIIVKQNSISPLGYKAKLISECSGNPGTSVKNDESFKPWDRVLRRYTDIITELQSRLK